MWLEFGKTMPAHVGDRLRNGWTVAGGGFVVRAPRHERRDLDAVDLVDDRPVAQLPTTWNSLGPFIVW